MKLYEGRFPRAHENPAHRMPLYSIGHREREKPIMRFAKIEKHRLKPLWMGSLSFLIPVLLMLLTFFSIGIHPFGDKGFILVDGKLQYVAFFSEYIRQIKASELPFFSRYFGFGLNFFGTWANYLASPANLLLLLFPATHILDGIVTVYLAKVGLCGITFYIYARRILSSESWKALLFSTSYALSGFVLYYSDNMQWMDGVIWLPILIMGLETLYRKGRCGFYPFIVAILVVSNFYISVLTGVFCLLYCFYIVFREPNDPLRVSKRNFLLKAGWNSLLGIGMAAFLLLPVYLQLKSQMNLTGQALPETWYTVNPFGTIGGLFIGRPDSLVDTSYPKLYAGLLPVTIAPFYFLSSQVKRREKWSAAIFLLLVFISFHISILVFVWQGLDYVGWFPYRYSFVFIFLLLTVAARAMNLPQEELRSHKKFRIVYYPVIAAICIFSILDFSRQDNLRLLLIAANLLFFVVWNYFLLKPGSSRALILIILCAELLINANVVFKMLNASAEYVNADTWTANYQSVENLIEENNLREQPGRTAIALQTISGNDPLLFSLKGIDYYSSAGDMELSNTLYQLGYDRYISDGYEISDNGGTLLSNSLLGVSSVIAEKSSVGEAAYPPLPYPGRHLLRRDQAGELTISKNPLALSCSYLVSPDILSFSMEKQQGNPFAVTDQLLSAMRGESLHTYKDVPVSIRASNADQKDTADGYRVFSIQNLKNTASVTMDFTGKGEEVPLYLYLDYDLLDQLSDVSGLSVRVVSDGKTEQIKKADLQTFPFVLSLGSYPNGEPIAVELEFRGQNLVIWDLRVAAQSADDLRDALAPLRDNPFELSWTSSCDLKITGNAQEDGVIFISVPYDAGWQATVNGKPASIRKVAGAFMGIETAAGKYDISLHYVPAGLKPGLYISITCAAAAILQVLLIRRRKRPDNGVPQDHSDLPQN